MRSWPGLLVVICAVLWTVAAHAVELEKYLLESFEDNGGEKSFFEGNLDNRVFSYQDGKYIINTTRGDSYGQSVIIDDLDTCRLEVTGRMVESGEAQGGGFGLSFNYRERDGSSEFLLFLVYDRGAFTVLKYSGGKTTPLFSPTKTRLFSAGETVNLRVETAKGQLVFFINNAEVAKLREDNLLSGGYGMFATVDSVVEFDDFTVFAEIKAEPETKAFDFETGKPLLEGSWEGIEFSYAGGRYFLDTTQTDMMGLSPFPTEAKNFEFYIDAELVDGDPVRGYGIYLRDFSVNSGEFNQYRLLVSGDWFAVERSEADHPLALADWIQHPAVKATGVNRLGVRAEGRSIIFFINGMEVYRCEDTNPQIGSFGLYASYGIRVAFDNASVTALP